MVHEKEFMPDSSIIAGQFARLRSGITLHYASAGQRGRPLLLFLHGFPEFWFAWRDMLPRFAHDHYVVAPDMRGYNLSDKPASVAAYRIDSLVDDVHGLIEALGYDAADLVAHDWGGAVAFAAVLSRPESFRRLMVLNAPHPVLFARALAHDARQQAASAYMLALREPAADESLMADDCEPLLSMFRVAGKDAWLTAEVADAYRAAWRTPGGIRGMLNYYRASPLMPPSPGAPGAAGVRLDPARFVVRVPTTVVWGQQDNMLLPVLLDGLAAMVPGHTLVRVTEATHWLVHEKPERVAAEISAFLERDR